MAKAKRSVTITAAQIMGGCTIVGAIIGAAALYLFSSPRAVDNSSPAVSDDSGRGSKAVGATDANQPVTLYDGSFEDYLGRLAAVQDRDFERQEFQRSMVGKRVMWRGWVDGVSEYGGATIVGLKASRERRSLDVVGVSFPSSEWRTKLYALHKGDQVEIDAIYHGIPDLIPVLEGLSISLIEAK